MNKIKNKYRTKSVRASFWDYGWNAANFVTINTKNRVKFFGDIRNGIMERSDVGEIADQFWLKISEIYSFVKLGEYIVMPNHVHGIVIIDKPMDPRFITDNPSSIAFTQGGVTDQNNPMLNDNLSNIIRSYKARVSFKSRKLLKEFAWQPKFHDHIIRDEKSFQRITNYIINNPWNWYNDLQR